MGESVKIGELRQLVCALMPPGDGGAVVMSVRGSGNKLEWDEASAKELEGLVVDCGFYLGPASVMLGF